METPRKNRFHRNIDLKSFTENFNKSYAGTREEKPQTPEDRKWKNFLSINQAIDENGFGYVPLKLVDDAITGDDKRTADVITKVNEEGKKEANRELEKMAKFLSFGIKQDAGALQNLNEQPQPEPDGSANLIKKTISLVDSPPKTREWAQEMPGGVEPLPEKKEIINNPIIEPILGEIAKNLTRIEGKYPNLTKKYKESIDRGMPIDLPKKEEDLVYQEVEATPKLTDYARDFGESFLSGIGSTIKGIPRTLTAIRETGRKYGIPISGFTINELFPKSETDDSGNRITLMEKMLHSTGDAINQIAEKIRPDDKIANNFWRDFMKSNGNMASFYGMGILSGALKAPRLMSIMINGGLMTAESEYKRIYEETKDKDAAANSIIPNFLLGMTEGIPVERALKTIGGIPKSGFRKFVQEQMINIGEEFIQETGQNIGSDITAKMLGGAQDKDIYGILEDALYQGLQAGLSSAVMGMSGAGIMKLREKIKGINKTGLDRIAEEEFQIGNKKLEIKSGEQENLPTAYRQSGRETQRGAEILSDKGAEEDITKVGSTTADAKNTLRNEEVKKGPAFEEFLAELGIKKEQTAPVRQGFNDFIKGLGEDSATRHGESSTADAENTELKEDEQSKTEKKGTEQSGEKKEYSSTQVNIPEKETKPILEYVNSLPKAELYTEDENKGAETEPHVTALYGLTTTDPKEIEKTVQNFGDIEVTLGKTSIFKNDKYDVLKVDIKSPDLKKLNKLLRDNHEYETDYPKYQPHMTIAYLKPGEGEKYAGDTRFEGTKIKLSELIFSDKERNHTTIKLIKGTDKAGTPDNSEKQEKTAGKAPAVTPKKEGTFDNYAQIYNKIQKEKSAIKDSGGYRIGNFGKTYKTETAAIKKITEVLDRMQQNGKMPDDLKLEYNKIKNPAAEPKKATAPETGLSTEEKPKTTIKQQKEDIAKISRHELPDVLDKGMLKTAQTFKKELEQAGRHSDNAFMTNINDNPNAAYDFSGDTKVFSRGVTISTYPDWFSELGKSRKEVMNALNKIIEDNGKDKGKLVEEVKKKILDSMKEGHERAVKIIKGGITKRGDVEYTPPIQEVTEFLEAIRDKKISKTQLRKAYKDFLQAENDRYGGEAEKLTAAEKEYWDQIAEEYKAIEKEDNIPPPFLMKDNGMIGGVIGDPQEYLKTLTAKLEDLQKKYDIFKKENRIGKFIDENTSYSADEQNPYIKARKDKLRENLETADEIFDIANRSENATQDLNSALEELRDKTPDIYEQYMKLRKEKDTYLQNIPALKARIKEVKTRIKEEGGQQAGIFDDNSQMSMFSRKRLTEIPLTEARGLQDRLIKRLVRSFPGMTKKDVIITGSTEEFLDELRDGEGYDSRRLDKNMEPVGYYGSDGKIHINGATATMDTPIHEFGHVWVKWAVLHDKELLAEGYRLVQADRDIMEEVRKLYPDVTSARRLEEALVAGITRQADGMYRNIINEKKRDTLTEKFKRWIKRLFDRIFGKEKSFEEYMSDRVKDLFYGKFESGEVVKKPADLMKKEYGKTFYSKLETVAAEKIQKSATPEQIKATLLNNGVKQAEYDWLGLDEFMAGKEKISKQDLLDYITMNKVEMKEVIKGENRTDKWVTDANIPNEWTLKGTDLYITRNDKTDKYIAYFGEGLDTQEYETLEAAKEAINESIDFNYTTTDSPSTDTKYSGYKTEGGENYKEVLLTLPEVGEYKNEYIKLVARIDELMEKEKAQEITENEKEELFYKLREQNSGKYTDEIKRYGRKKLLASLEKGKTEQFKSIHFDEPNIALHLRLQDFNESGKKVLLIEELQSDWGQAGKRKGYKKNLLELPEGWEITNPNGNTYKLYKTDGTVLVTSAINYRTAKKQFLYGLNNEGVPDMPFKKNWQEVGMKWALRYAVENGYDKIAWTTGEQQAERYDLSKQVDEVVVRKPNNEFGEYSVDAKKDGNLVGGKFLKENELEGFIGKDLAKKIIDDFKNEKYSLPEHKANVYKGVDLKVGDSGMRGFYDKILPDFMNKYTKKWGGKVGESNIGIQENYKEISEEHARTLFDREAEIFEKRNDDENPEANGYWLVDDFETLEDIINNGDNIYIRKKAKPLIVHSLDITEAMRRDVLFSGQPMFAKKYKGENAIKTAEEMKKLELAKKMEKQGASGEEIFNATGWRKGEYDGAWRTQSSISGLQSSMEQKDITETENFKKWFGDSKVVDENGKPLVVYHGTGKTFNKFNFKKTAQGVMWFTNDKRAIEKGNVGASSSGKIMPVYLTIKNPAGWNEYEKLGLGQIEDRGYDGIILEQNGQPTDYIVFNPTQIKSATGNSGAFDAGNPDIRFARKKKGGESDREYFDLNRDNFEILGREILENMPQLTDAGFFEEMNKVLASGTGKFRLTEEMAGEILRKISSEPAQPSPTAEAAPPLAGDRKSGSKERVVNGRVIPKGKEVRRFYNQIEKDKEMPESVKDELWEKALYEQVGNKAVVSEANAKIEELGGDDNAYTALVTKQGFWKTTIGEAGSGDLRDVPMLVKHAMGLILMRRYTDKVNNAMAAGDEKTGNIEMTRLLDLSENMMFRGTDAGRQVQIYSIFGRLSKEGMLLYAARQVSHANKKRQVRAEEEGKTAKERVNQINKKNIDRALEEQKERLDELETRGRARIQGEGDGTIDTSEKDLAGALDDYQKEIARLRKQVQEEHGAGSEQDKALKEYIENLKKQLIEAEKKNQDLITALGEILPALVEKGTGKAGKSGLDSRSGASGNDKGEGDSGKSGKDGGKPPTEGVDNELEDRLNTAAEKLATRIKNNQFRKQQTEEQRIINEIVRTLFNIAVEKELIDKHEKEKENIFERLREAVKQEKDRKEVWEKAKPIVREKIKEHFAQQSAEKNGVDPRSKASGDDKKEAEMEAAEKNTENMINEAFEKLEKYFKHELQDPFTEQMVNKAARQILKDSGIKLKDLIKKHYTEIAQTTNDLAAKMIEQCGLTETEAAGLIKEFGNQMKKLTAEAKEKALLRMLGPIEKIKKAKKMRRIFQEIIEASNMGFLSDKDALEIIKQKYDFAKLTSENAEQIMKYAEEIQGMPPGSVQQVMKISEMMNYIKNAQGFGWGEMSWSMLYANQLSGFWTHIKNVKYNVFNQIMEVFARNPLEWKYAIQGALEGLGNEGIDEFKFTMQHGTGGHGSKFEFDDVAAQGIVERYNNGAIKKGVILKNMPEPIKKPVVESLAAGLIYARTVMRFLYAEDRWSFAGLKEMEALPMAREIAKTEGLKGKDLDARVQELLNNSATAIEKAKIQAEKEGLKPGTTIFDKRVYQIREWGRPKEIIDATHKYAARGTLNYDPKGIIGSISHMFEFGRKQPGGKSSIFILPYIRIVANVLNNNLDFTPLGYKRAWRGYTDDISAGHRPTERERTAELYRATIGTLFFVGLLGYIIGVPDDKKPFKITANGTGNLNRNKQLEQTGWKPYSIYIRGTGWVSYLDTPLQIPLTVLGFIQDKFSYRKEALEDDNVIEVWGQIAMISLSSTLNQSFLLNAKEFMSAWDEGNPDKMKKYLGRLGVGIATSYTVPNLIRHISRIFDNQQYETDNLMQAYMRNWGIALSSLGLRPKLNLLGEPVLNDPTPLFSKENESPIWNWIIKNSAYIPTPKEETIIYDRSLMNPKTGEKGMDRAMTQDEYYKFVKTSGELIKQGLEKAIPELDKIEDLDVRRKYAKRLYQMARDTAKERLAGVSTMDDIAPKHIENFDKTVRMYYEEEKTQVTALKHKIKTPDGNDWQYRIGDKEKIAMEFDKGRVKRLLDGKTGDIDGFISEMQLENVDAEDTLEDSGYEVLHGRVIKKQ